MKKWVIVLAFLVASTLLFGAAVAETKEKEIQTLVFYRLSAASHDAYCLPLMQAFMEENPDIVIEDVVVTSGGYEALASKVLLANAAGTPGCRNDGLFAHKDDGGKRKCR